MLAGSLDVTFEDLFATVVRESIEKMCEAAPATRVVRFLGDAKSLLGDTKSSLGDTKSSLGDAKSSLGDAKSSLGDDKSSLGDANPARGQAGWCG
jgi:hypothetical protein